MPSRQALWQRANLLVGLCRCGRKRWVSRGRQYAQCRKHVLLQRARYGVKGPPGKKGGRPPGPMKRWVWEMAEKTRPKTRVVDLGKLGRVLEEEEAGEGQGEE